MMLQTDNILVLVLHSNLM